MEPDKSECDGVDCASRGRTSRAPWTMAGLALSMLLASLGVSIANVALPTLAEAFGASFHAVQWIVLAYLLAITIMIVSVGRLGDILGRRRVLLAGILLFTAASILCGVAPTLWALILARAVQGLGAAILMALTVALVRETVAKERTGTAMGLLGTMSAIGTALGPSLGGLLIAGPGWRAIFLVMVPLGIIAFALTCRTLAHDRQRQRPDRHCFDGLGTLLLGLTIAAYALSMTTGPIAKGRGQFDGLNLMLLCAAVVAAGLFILVEARATAPLIRLSSFRNVLLSVGLIMNALVSTVMMTTLVVGPFFLTLSLGLREVLVGAVMTIGPAVSALTGVPSGRIVDRLGAPFILVVGLVLMAAGSLALSLLPGAFGLAGYIAAIAVLTPGYQLFQAANNTAVMTDTGPDQRGVVSGMLSLSRNLGLITGASVMGAVFAFATAATDIGAASPQAVATGLRITFGVAAVLMAAALALAVGAGVAFRRKSLSTEVTGGD